MMPDSDDAKENNISTVNSSLKREQIIFYSIMLGLILFAVLRSSITTKLDGFTLDEAYHITAGVSYVRTGDYRLNPEHPPLVKLWVGMWFPGESFKMPPFRPLKDKPDERNFTDEAVDTDNDPDRVQARARLAMFVFHGILLFFFTLAARRVFGWLVALAALGFLAIDPTVAAHIPVVMTDLPVALLSATAMLWAIAAFRSWKLRDLALAALFLGLTLTAKHSGLVTVVAVALFGVVMALITPRLEKVEGKKHVLCAKRFGTVALVMFAALVVLWSSYRFRFDESREGRDLFNRPLAEKIDDVNSKFYKTSLQIMNRGHLLPRAYIWGLADTVRAGVEGRSTPILFFGKLYYKKAPFYFFAGVFLVKLPLGLIALVFTGLFFFITRKVSREWLLPLTGISAFALVFLFVLASGSPYAGVRHALAVYPVFALVGAIAIVKAIETKSYALRGVVALAIAGAFVSAVPQMRPWEYFNETVGGSANAWCYFSDEGVDLGQRRLELTNYYNEHLKPHGEVPHIIYYFNEEERERRSIHWVGENPDEEINLDESKTVTGTFFVSAAFLAPSLWWDMASMREVTPVARYGNLFVFRGTFDSTWLRAADYFFQATEVLYAPEPDEEKAEKLLAKSVELDPRAFFVAIELGNLRAKRGEREAAISAYKIALENSPAGDGIIEQLRAQIERVSKEPPESVTPLRNPFLE